MTEPETERPRPPSYAEVPPRFIGGHLCLDFINTLSLRGAVPDPRDRLSDYRELLLWARAAGLLSKSEARRLERESRQRPAAAAAVLAFAKELREALARLVGQAGKGRPADLTLLNETLARAPARRSLVARARGYAWHEEAPGEPLEQPLWPVLREAARLLTSDELARVRACASEKCRWLFLDLSRNGSRRWCRMADCGNRAKARRHYAKTRSA